MKRIIKKILNYIREPIELVVFYFSVYNLKGKKKIIYAITPPPSLRNIGDHAQVVAIRKWMQAFFSDYLVLELDKYQTKKFSSVIKQIINHGDLIFLHSGGNLGDRGIWSETVRRLVISNFPNNKIISLPQTIFFSKTEIGDKELEITKKIYNAHPDLTIIARDEYSFSLAKEYFHNCNNLLLPDFVLYLDQQNVDYVRTKSVILCLRNDDESIIDKQTRADIKAQLKAIGVETIEYDTTLNQDIPSTNREAELNRVLTLFSNHALVVTDRFHGTIFSVLTRTPCIVLKTVDHKLLESVKWFRDLNFVVFLDDLTQLTVKVKEMMEIKQFNSIKWRDEYYDPLKKKIGL